MTEKNYEKMWNELKKEMYEASIIHPKGNGFLHEPENSIFERMLELENPKLISDEEKRMLMYPECLKCQKTYHCKDSRIKPPFCSIYILRYKERILRYLEALANKINEGWKPDWENSNKLKFIIYFDNNSKSYYVDTFSIRQNISDFYFGNDTSAQLFLDQAKKELDELREMDK